MDATAIKQIQESQTVTEINRELTRSEVGYHVIAIPKEYSLNSLEKYHETRDRFRGTMETKSIPEFAAYAKQYATEGATTFISAARMTAKHIIDLGSTESAGHCEHKAIVGLEKTAPYTALLDIIDKRKSQREIAEFIEDWRAFLKAFYDEDIDGNAPEMSIVKALHAVRKIKIEANTSSENEARTFGATSTSMESIDITSQDKPPAYLHFTCEPYAGLPARTFIARLGVITDKTPALVLRIVQSELHQEEMAEQFQDLIINAVKDIEPPVTTFIGTFSE